METRESENIQATSVVTVMQSSAFILSVELHKCSSIVAEST
jgi:hypothetical protein